MPDYAVPPVPAMRLAHHVLSILYGLFWLWSGTAKLRDPAAFALAVSHFQLLGDPFVALTALSVPAIEVVCALAVVFRRQAAGALAILSICLAVFTAAIAISWARGLDISCGCFGSADDSPVNYPVKVAQNLILLALGGWLWWVELRQPSRAPAPGEALA